jgi:hypothetical protein
MFNEADLKSVRFNENELVLITGTADQLRYESALDAATLVTIAGPAPAGEIDTE